MNKEAFLFIYSSEYEVNKFGGTITGSERGLQRIVDIVKKSEATPVLVVSAARGMTSLLIRIIKNIEERKIPGYVDHITHMHDLLSPTKLEENAEFMHQVDRLRRVLYGVCYTGELSPTISDLVVSFGERLIVFVVADVLRTSGIEHEIIILYPEDFLVTNGRVKQASINLEASQDLLQKKMTEVRKPGVKQVFIIPGFYGVSEDGKVNLFGRSGTDYSASAVAYLLNSQRVMVWKDVAGFLSADPNVVPDAVKIPELSYSEASELSHFGAQILHHRAALPAKIKGIPIHICNIYDPSAVTVIKQTSNSEDRVIKSITYMKNLCILKFFNTSGAAESGIVSGITHVLAKHGIDIISIATSQTCIAFLVKEDSVTEKMKDIKNDASSYIDSVSITHGIALIACVGEKLSKTPGIAFRTFKAASDKGVNIDLISAGASTSALHFTVAEEDLEVAVQAIHKEFVA